MDLIPELGRASGEGIPTPVFLPGESHGQRNLVDYRLWGCKESNTTAHAHMTHTCATPGLPWGLTSYYVKCWSCAQRAGSTQWTPASSGRMMHIFTLCCSPLFSSKSTISDPVTHKHQLQMVLITIFPVREENIPSFLESRLWFLPFLFFLDFPTFSNNPFNSDTARAWSWEQEGKVHYNN